MGAIRPPKRAKLLCGLLTGDPDLLIMAQRRLAKHFGPIEFTSNAWPFTATDYYEPELGSDVKRQFAFFEQLVSIERLAEIKRLTIDIETRICDDLALPHTARPVNIDPGYITMSKLVLATTKEQSHRIYIQRGIFAEVTLRFESGVWKSWPWTYPDYASNTYHDVFAEARARLREQLGAF